MNINIPYGNGQIRFSIPRKRVAGILNNKKFPAKNIKPLIAQALSDKTLENMVLGKKKILIVVPDATRSAHLTDLLPAILRKIASGQRKIDIIIATGLHKKHTPEELKKLLGASIVRRCDILQHDPSKDSVIDFGLTEYGVPITLDKNLLNYEFVISIGVIEPHLYAGYSGGAKTIAIGLAGEATINATHSVRFLDDPSVNIGNLVENKFQETLWHIIDKIQLSFSVNIVNSPGGKAIKVFAGPTRDVFKDGAILAKKVFEVKVKRQAQIAICGIGCPKDINLYQASRALNYILNADGSIVQKKGFVIVAAEMKDGIGSSFAEKRFYEELRNMRSPKDFLSRVKAGGCVAGEHRAYMVAKVLMDYNVLFVSAGKRDFLQNLPFKSFSNIKDALSYADGIRGKNTKIYFVPRSLATIARADSA